MFNKKVCCVIVSYNSDVKHLAGVLGDLVNYCNVVVVDNSTTTSSQAGVRDVCNKCSVHLISLNDNFGIAYAQNLGLTWARNQGCTDILLLDDDSTPNSNFVSGLLQAQSEITHGVAVIGAITISADGKNLSNRRKSAMKGFSLCSHLNSSGTLVPISVFDKVGYFDESLFIDCVDFEWGWRVRSSGIPLLLCENVVIQHRLGQSSRFGFKIASPVRHYYQYRNILKMIFQSKAPIFWRISQLVKLPVKLLLIMLIADCRFVRLRYAYYGFVDFVFQRYGKFNHKHR